MSSLLHQPVAIDLSSPSRTPRRVFDGVICFGGEDWWYHNRGHYDMQLMRRLARDVPVLYVNSIGMRSPRVREGRMFLRRLIRKLRSVRRGFVRLDERLAVFSPLSIPGRLGAKLNAATLAPQVKMAAAELGIRRPLVWVACPTAASAVDALHPSAVVYQRTDRFEEFPDVDVRRITQCDSWLKARADLTAFCAGFLFDQERNDCAAAELIPHGVDFDQFAAAGLGHAAPVPPDIAAVGRPRVGFVGGIDAHTFNADLFVQVAARLPHAQFVLVGACSLPRGWCNAPNVAMLGQKPYDSVASYMAACDVLIMPWRSGRWIEGCNPVKLREYLAVGRPIVSTPFPEISQYQQFVHVAADAKGFAQAIELACERAADAPAMRDAVRGQTWDARDEQLRSALRERGIVARDSSHASPRAANRKRDDAMCGCHHEVAESRLHSSNPDSPTTDVHVRELKFAVASSPHPTLTHSPTHALDGSTAATAGELIACVLLTGGLRPSSLVRFAGRSVLDLYLTRERSVLDAWVHILRRLDDPERNRTTVRIIHDCHLPVPWPRASAAEAVRVEREPRPLRGPAGIASDVCRMYRPNQHVLLADAARFVGCDLNPLVHQHLSSDADITIARNPDGAPAGVWMIRCGVLSHVRPHGYVDFKEQFIARAVARGAIARVFDCAEPGVLPLRSREEFLAAARWCSESKSLAIAGEAEAAESADSIAPPFNVLCRGAFIGRGAIVRDSVIMPGAHVEPDCVIVRSVITPQARIKRASNIADAVVGASAGLSDRHTLRAQRAEIRP